MQTYAEGKRQSLSDFSAMPVEYQQGEVSCIKRRVQRQYFSEEAIFLCVDTNPKASGPIHKKLLIVVNYQTQTN